MLLDPSWPDSEDGFQVFGYPSEGGAVLLTPARLTYRGPHGTMPAVFLDLASDTIKPGMSGAALLNLRTGAVCGLIVASKNTARPDGALAVPWTAVQTGLADVITANSAFHDTDQRWKEAWQLMACRPLGVNTSAPATPQTLPRDISSFTGRRAELRRLIRASTRITRAGGAVRIHAIGGMAGVGKTAFAVHAAHQLAARFPDGQFFLPLHAHALGQRPVHPTDALETLLLTVGVAPQQIPSGMDARAGLWRDHLAGKRVLLLLDDASGHDQIEPLLPGAAGNLVMITSRHRLIGLDDIMPISLETLLPDEAATLVARLIGRRRQNLDADSVNEITRLCGYLPLAIRLVIGRTRHHIDLSLAELATELAVARDRLAAMHAENLSVAAAFELSYRGLTGGQKQLFRYLGLHPGPEIEACAVANLDGSDLVTTRRHLDDLFNYHLLGEVASGRYYLHDLVREYAQSLAAADDPAAQAAALGRLLDYYLHTAVAANRLIAPLAAINYEIDNSPVCVPELSTREQALNWMATERGNLHAVVDFASARKSSSHGIGIPAAMDVFLRAQGYWGEAIRLHQTAVAIASENGNLLNQANALRYLGLAQYLTDDYGPAMESLTHALDLFTQLGDRLGQAQALNYLGAVQQHVAEYAQAASNLAQALELFTELDDKLGQARALADLGTVQYLTDEYPKAAASLARALELFTELGDQFGEAQTLADLGSLHYLTDEYAQASRSLARSLDLFTKLDNRYGQAWVLDCLGTLQRQMGEYEQATKSLTRALDLSQEPGDDDYARALALKDLGAVHCELLEYDQATDRLNEALGLFAKLGERLGQAQALKNLGAVHYGIGEYEQANDSLTKALGLFIELSNRLGQAQTLNHIGTLMSVRSTFNEIPAQYIQGLNIAREIGSPFEEARALEGIANICIKNGRLDEGVEHLHQALAIYQRIGSPRALYVQDVLRDCSF